MRLPFGYRLVREEQHPECTIVTVALDTKAVAEAVLREAARRSRLA